MQRQGLDLGERRREFGLPIVPRNNNEAFKRRTVERLCRAERPSSAFPKSEAPFSRLLLLRVLCATVGQNLVFLRGFSGIALLPFSIVLVLVLEWHS